MSQTIEPEDLPQRITAVDPNKGRCLVENHPLPADSEQVGIEYCHVFPQELKHNIHLMDSLEWSWKMRKGTLNLDTRYNVFPACASVAKLFRAHKFILLPDDEIIDKYEDCLYTFARHEGVSRRDRFPIFENGLFQYRLLPVSDMEQVIFTHHDNDTNTPTVHKYPFDALPKLTSHIHPKFVIAAIGRRLVSPDYEMYRNVFDQYCILSKVMSLYEFWSAPYPGVAEEDSSFFPEYFLAAEREAGHADDRSSRAGSVKTEKGRGYNRPLPDTPGPDPNFDPPLSVTNTDDKESDKNESDPENLERKRAVRRLLKRPRLYDPIGNSKKKRKRKRRMGKDSEVDVDEEMWTNEAVSKWARSVSPGIGTTYIQEK